jgi:hypothetical protein
LMLLKESEGSKVRSSIPVVLSQLEPARADWKNTSSHQIFTAAIGGIGLSPHLLYCTFGSSNYQSPSDRNKESIIILASSLRQVRKAAKKEA